MIGLDISNTSQVAGQKKANSSLDSIIAFLNKDISLSKNFPDKKKEAFYSDLFILLSSNLDIKTVLELIEQGQNKKKDQYLIKEIKGKVISGRPLSTALISTGKFSNYETISLKIGEETGKTVEVAQQLLVYYKNKIKQKRLLINALTYPSVVMATSIMAVIFLLKYVVPMFAGIFKRFGGELPTITRFIINASNLVSSDFGVFMGFVILFSSFVFIVRKKQWYRKFASAVILRTPVFGDLIMKVHLARMSSSMELLVSAKISLVKAISLVRQISDFYPIESSLEQIEKDLWKGTTLYSSMSRYKIYPGRMVALVKVGEQVNRLDRIFKNLSDQYTEEVEYKTKTIGNLLEPFIIIFLGGVVGFILIAMYLPLFQLSNVIK